MRIGFAYPLYELGFGLALSLAAAFGGITWVAVVLSFIVLLSFGEALRRRRFQRGITLVETLVSFTLLVLLLALFVDALSIPRQAELKALRGDVAQQLVQERLETLKDLAWADDVSVLDGQAGEQPISVGGDTYTVTTNVGAFPVSEPNDKLRQVTVEVRLGTAAVPASSLQLVQTQVSLVVRGRFDDEWP